jgi:alkyl sulfatase BDS1-like metallo-beta-lactamase superfamily hydrolase
MGYQAESATWRNAFLYGAQELRHGVFQVSARVVASADTLAGLSTDVFFDALEIRLDPARAAAQSFVLNWRFTDRDEEMTLTLKHCTLTHRMGEQAGAPSASVTTTRATLDALVLRKTTAPEALQSGALRIEGDASKFVQLFTMLDQPGGMMFDILTPGEGR